MSTRAEITYHGDVQGVGFRATTVGLAQNLPVSGFVKNMPDGSVKLVAEGEEADVKKLLDQVSEQLGSHIEDVERQSGQATGEYDGFHIA